MATKDDYPFLLKSKQDTISDDSLNVQYKNLNLNQANHQISSFTNAFSEASKNVLIEKRKDLDYGKKNKCYCCSLILS